MSFDCEDDQGLDRKPISSGLPVKLFIVNYSGGSFRMRALTNDDQLDTKGKSQATMQMMACRWRDRG